jgi:hypothetical protein
MNTKIAMIEWLPQSQGGRLAPPIGPRYVAPVKFDSDSGDWPVEAWSLVVDRIDAPHGPNKWLARVGFLVDEAPHERLTDDADFGLYEGKRCVARGHVVSRVETALATFREV